MTDSRFGKTLPERDNHNTLFKKQPKFSKLDQIWQGTSLAWKEPKLGTAKRKKGENAAPIRRERGALLPEGLRGAKDFLDSSRTY
ncbi:hypothetical protein O3V59_12465 [Brevibacillus thermoruber]|jgi:hypothetical protein|uniref:Uncharacterized protein n=1 Tax=Brevibacillus thermoruber TaxID=33942 RepID=A0A9X3TRS5_9BACL|nr:hypothetical protein [Brevibacillus thermoruber]MDA5109180.1 hypothetical protein [Brevibacillus thermoruber]